MVKKIYLFVIFVVCLLLVIIDLIAGWYPSSGRFGVYLWIFSFTFLMIFIIKQLSVFLQMVKKGRVATLIVVLFLIVKVLFNANNPVNISGETTQEIACSLNHFEIDPGLGFKKTCLFGYPARQFFLPALPSLLFGRSLFNLNFGSSLYFIIGLLVFSTALLKFFKKSVIGDLVSAIIIAGFFHIYYFNHFMFLYEQSIFPLSFGLILCGLFLHYIYERSTEILLLSELVILYLIFSYTPALAILFLALVVLIKLLFDGQTRRQQKILIVIMIGLLLISFFLSIKIRSDINLIFSEIPLSQRVNDLITVFKHIIFQTEGSSWISPIYQLIFLSVIFFSLIFIFGWRVFVVAIWIIMTLILSVISKGYSYYSVDFRLHRAIVIFPVMFTMMAIIAKLIKDILFAHRRIFYILVGFFLLIFTTGIFYQDNYLKTKSPSRHLTLIYWLKSKMSESLQNQKNALYFDKDLTDEYISINDSLQYFLPHSRSYILEDDCPNDDQLESGNTFIFLTQSKVARCKISKKIKYHTIDSFTFEKDKALDFYSISF